MKALISVSNKDGIVKFASELVKLGYEILSTGGTAKLLRENRISVKDVSEYTGFPEMMDGRIKSLHPKVHGGLLAIRDNKEHMEQAKKNKIEMIDLVVVNLYPFQQFISSQLNAGKKVEDVKIDEAIEQIDIGGPTILRAAAKNYKYVTVVIGPNDYGAVLDELKKSKSANKIPSTTLQTRQKLALKVFRHTADYDSAIDKFLSEKLHGEKILRMKFIAGRKLRYGENPHQQGIFYVADTSNIVVPNISNSIQLHGKEMSYNNYLDGDAALEAVKEHSKEVAACVVKHTNPCGLATGKSLAEALEHAWHGDTVSSFGSIIAVTRKVDLKSAEFLKGKFVEALIAPEFDDDALEFLKNKSKDIRLLQVIGLDNYDAIGAKDSNGVKVSNIYRSVGGGILEQNTDSQNYSEWKLITKAKFSETKNALAEFAWKACKHTKSNAIVLGYEYSPGKFMVVGMGAGQPNRVDSLRKLAITKAIENFELMKFSKKEFAQKFGECVLASDAFFPFADTVEIAAEQGIKYIVQPGGSIRDNEVIDAANKHGIAMIFTGMRHFRH
ncbi:bifunctional phosphoribosylaminoimidazolecarboxamide formyltransferase/IMP cyclohydrolase [Candidatus Woesearchaeota archaeon]|nr:bifunctional phosphoribosylaminoimidazolecarboxamide formyltransferase/IMP cyclohydrolase [Candidatus Woesearchaeota archaeon]